MDSVDETKIGEVISNKGFEHTVYAYSTDKVIKIPKKTVFSVFNKDANLSQDYKICKKYFQDYLLESEFMFDKCSNSLAIVQPKIEPMIYFSSKIDKKYYSQLNEIINIFEKLKNDKGLSIDLTGREATWHNIFEMVKFWKMKEFYLSNVCISDGKLLIFDFRVSPTKLRNVTGLLSLILVLYTKLEFQWNKFFLNQIKNSNK